MSLPKPLKKRLLPPLLRNNNSNNYKKPFSLSSNVPTPNSFEHQDEEEGEEKDTLSDFTATGYDDDDLTFFPAQTKVGPQDKGKEEEEEDDDDGDDDDDDEGEEYEIATYVTYSKMPKPVNSSSSSSSDTVCDLNEEDLEALTYYPAVEKVDDEEQDEDDDVEDEIVEKVASRKKNKKNKFDSYSSEDEDEDEDNEDEDEDEDKDDDPEFVPESHSEQKSPVEKSKESGRESKNKRRVGHTHFISQNPEKRLRRAKTKDDDPEFIPELHAEQELPVRKSKKASCRKLSNRKHVEKYTYIVSRAIGRNQGKRMR